jgi:hypothetical protein
MSYCTFIVGVAKLAMASETDRKHAKLSMHLQPQHFDYSLIFALEMTIHIINKWYR